MLIFADIWSVIAEHGGTFLFGVLVGLIAASRYRIVRVNGNSNHKS